MNKPPIKKNPIKDLGIYLHIPFCRRKCGYCDFHSGPCPDKKELSEFIQALKRQISETAPVAGDALVDSVYFGGGTPLMLGAPALCGILRHIRRLFRLTKDAEVTVELNPESTDKKSMKALRRAGFNRASLGMQSSSDEELSWLSRLHSHSDTVAAARCIRDAGFQNLSVDLMFGLRGQTVSGFLGTVEKASELRPTHISCYGLKLESGVPLASSGPQSLPDGDAQADMYAEACAALKSLGFSHYEISNFALPGFESRHNMKYWTLAPYLGFGPSAHSDCFGRRYSTIRSTGAYIEAVNTGGALICELETISKDERAREYIMLGLRTARGISSGEFTKRFRLPFDRLEDRLMFFSRGGLALLENGRWRLSERGFFVSNAIISDILDGISAEICAREK